jgi:hypothetical protein
MINLIFYIIVGYFCVSFLISLFSVILLNYLEHINRIIDIEELRILLYKRNKLYNSIGKNLCLFVSWFICFSIGPIILIYKIIELLKRKKY